LPLSSTFIAGGTLNQLSPDAIPAAMSVEPTPVDPVFVLMIVFASLTGVSLAAAIVFIVLYVKGRRAPLSPKTEKIEDIVKDNTSEENTNE
jgi:hypothetical protein